MRAGIFRREWVMASALLIQSIPHLPLSSRPVVLAPGGRRLLRHGGVKSRNASAHTDL